MVCCANTSHAIPAGREDEAEPGAGSDLPPAASGRTAYSLGSMLEVLLNALLCVLIVTSIAAFVWYSLSALRFAYQIYDHLPDVNRLVARTSILAAVAFARLSGEGKRLRAGFFRSIGACFLSALLAAIFLFALLILGPFR